MITAEYPVTISIGKQKYHHSSISEELEKKLDTAVRALNHIKIVTDNERPNSGHSYLAIINDCGDIATDVLLELDIKEKDEI